MPTTTMAAWSTAHVAVRVRNRRVQASGEVRPRRPKPKGPNATAAAEPNAAPVQRAASTSPASPTSTPSTFAGVVRHHRRTKREAESGR